MKAFYRRLKASEKAGYPRYQGRDHYESFTYPQGGYSLTHDNRVSLSKIGSVMVKLHRTIEGTVKTCTVKREGEHGMWCSVVNWKRGKQHACPLPMMQ